VKWREYLEKEAIWMKDKYMANAKEVIKALGTKGNQTSDCQHIDEDINFY